MEGQELISSWPYWPLLFKYLSAVVLMGVSVWAVDKQHIEKQAFFLILAACWVAIGVNVMSSP